MNHTALTHTGTIGHIKQLTRRWPVLLGAVVGLLSMQPWAPASVTTYFLPVLALIYLVFGLSRGHLRRPGVMSLQLAGLLAFTALGVVALVVDPDVGRYVVAGGWLAHAIWDAVHLRKDMVVPKWYAEACIVTDVLVAAALLIA